MLLFCFTEKLYHRNRNIVKVSNYEIVKFLYGFYNVLESVKITQYTVCEKGGMNHDL